MLGFSLTKLLVLIAIIAIVWYGFKYVGRRNEIAAKAAKPKPVDEKSAGSVDMEKCSVCGTFVPNGAARHCGRDACPFPR